MFCLFQELYYWYLREDWWLSPFYYVTGWSWYTWVIYNALAVLAHLRQDYYMTSQKTAEQDSESPWHLWKILTIFHELAIVSALVVTCGFWLFIYPTYPWPMYFLDYSRHGAPLICMLIDFHLGRSRIYARHWISQIVSNSIYLCNLF